MIYIIITSSINNKTGVNNAEHRKNRYIYCIQSLLKLIENNSNIIPIIVENNGQRHTFLDELNCEIVYTNNNDFHCTHKGVNELLDIKEVIEKYNIQENDCIIKLTGRYRIMNLSFIENVIRNIELYDAFVKFFNVCTFEYTKYDSILGLFAIKCKHIKDFEYHFKKSPECEFADHIRKTIDENKIMEIDDLHLECCCADDLRILHV
jgi:hypothetical protein